MRTLFSLTALLLLAIALALFAQFNQGTVLLLYPPYRVDLSLNLALLLLIGGFFIIYFLLRTFNSLLTLPQRALLYRRQQQQNDASNALREAWTSLIAGRFLRAEKMARTAQNWPEYAQIAALVGAQAAHGMHESTRRDQWLDQVHDAKLQQARGVARAEMQLEARDPLGALETINQLQAHGGRHIQVKRIALRAHQQLKNYTEVLHLVRLLEKRHALHPAVVASIKQQACAQLLEERRHDASALLAFWHGLNTRERCLPRNASLAARLLIPLGRHHAAQTILEQALKANWDPSLLIPYAECAASEVSALPLIAEIEGWLRTYPREAALHYALGRLCWHQRLWGKAQSSLENCLSYSSADTVMQSRAHLALAQLHERLQRPALAQEHYRASALLQLTSAPLAQKPVLA